MARLTKVFTFDASHQLLGYEGKCNRLHGHTWRLEVTIEGPIFSSPGSSVDGMVLDYAELSSFIKRSILDDNGLDHSHLNDIKDLARPTSELLAVWIFQIVRPWIQTKYSWRKVSLYSIKLWETPTSCCEVTADDVAYSR